MNLQIELWQLITLLLAFLGSAGAAGKLLLVQSQRHLDARLAAQDSTSQKNHEQLQSRLQRLEDAARAESAQWQRVERELFELKADLPVRFVMREDYVRGQSVIEAKLDGLAMRIENIQLRSSAARELPARG